MKNWFDLDDLYLTISFFCGVLFVHLIYLFCNCFYGFSIDMLIFDC